MIMIQATFVETPQAKKFTGKSQHCNSTMSSILVVEGAFKKDVLKRFKDELNNCTQWESYPDLMKRKTRFWAHCNCIYEYDTPGNKKSVRSVAQKYPPILYQIQHWVLRAIEKAFPKIYKKIGKNKPNCCNGNLYEDDAGCGPHSDNEYLFDGQNRPTAIYSFSLGNSAIFKSKPSHGREKMCTTGLFNDIQVNDGTIIVMIGWNQRCFVHEATRASHLINVTFRTIVDGYHSPQCLSWKSSNDDSDRKENMKKQLKQVKPNVNTKTAHHFSNIK